MEKVSSRQRKIRRIRSKIAQLGEIRLTVHKTAGHIYAQVFTSQGDKVLASASSVEKEIRTQAKDLVGQGKIKIAEAVGSLVAQRAKAQGIGKVAFDRSGFKYHGRIKALADSARAAGLEF